MKLPAACLFALTIGSSPLVKATTHNRAFIGSKGSRGLRAYKGTLGKKLFERHQEKEKTSPFLLSMIPRGKSGSRSESSSRSLQTFVGWKPIGDEIEADAYYDRAGDAVAINADGTRVVFGAYNSRGKRGQVKVFDYNAAADEWEQLGPDIVGLSGDELGTSISISDDGDVLAIGAPNHSNYLGTTRVYTYDPDVGTTGRWVPLGVDIDGISRGDKAGESVYLSGDGKRLALGADEAGEILNGYVMVFEFNGGSWVQIGQTIDGENTYYGTGSNVALNKDGSRLMVSSNIQPLNNLRLVGGVEVFRYDDASNEWVKIGQSFRGNTYYELYGDGADINSAGDRIAIGVANHDPVSVGKNAGMVQVFQYDEGRDIWVQMGNNINGDEAQDSFGMSVSIDGSGTRIIAGAGRADQVGTKNNGEARIFDFDETINDWVQVGNTIHGECELDESGRAVDISRDGSRVVVGAPLNWYYSGHIRIFEAAPGYIEVVPESCYTFNPQPTPAPKPTPTPTSSPTKSPTSEPTSTPTAIPSVTPTIKLITYQTYGKASVQSQDIAICSMKDEISNGLIFALKAVEDEGTEITVLDVATNCPSQRQLQNIFVDESGYNFDFTLVVTRVVPESVFEDQETVADVLIPDLETITADVVEQAEIEVIIEVTNIESPSASPTSTPSTSPTSTPTVSPTSSPSASPTKSPSSSPTASPTTSTPTVSPTSSPNASPTSSPSSSPTASPTTSTPTVSPTSSPSASPTSSPSSSPTASPSNAPSLGPSALPTKKPTLSPSKSPIALPSKAPTSSPSLSPIAKMSSSPSSSPITTLSPSTSPGGKSDGMSTTIVAIIIVAGITFIAALLFIIWRCCIVPKREKTEPGDVDHDDKVEIESTGGNQDIQMFVDMDEDISMGASVPTHAADMDGMSLATGMFTFAKSTSLDRPINDSESLRTTDLDGISLVHGIEGVKSVSQDPPVGDYSVISGVTSFDKDPPQTSAAP